MTIYEEIREKIACPQFGDDHYGKWGSLNFEQRVKIKELCEKALITNDLYWNAISEFCEIDNSKITIPTDWFFELREKAEKYDEIMAKRKKASEKSKASLMKNMTAEERKARALKAIQARWRKK